MLLVDVLCAGYCSKHVSLDVMTIAKRRDDSKRRNK